MRLIAVERQSIFIQNQLGTAGPGLLRVLVIVELNGLLADGLPIVQSRVYELCRSHHDSVRVKVHLLAYSSVSD